ncbi:butyrophilin subfamily 2 member A2-like isoform X11 [Xenopus tropicalis]|uniref:Butyrophilin subfamily 2 member A2-like isoform X11 n=1 Tax=Xenopus tropicalis TaxID=8364 RepID=A0A8J1IM95_XENTR|nr:butyrophilin subfamily 2 member A2-like isoform X11 [Xenopus tropicalis]
MASIMNNIMIASFILWALYTECLSVRFKVSSIPSVSVALGSDVVLPCTLTPEKNGEEMEIRWFKKIYQPYAHLYMNGKDDYTAQMPQFANRTELLKENITRGIFPLKIHKVTAQDSGEYHCYVESSHHHSMAAVQLQVTGLEHSQTSRNTHSRVYVIGAGIILIFFGCICFLLRSLGDIWDKHGDLQRKYGDIWDKHGALQRKYKALLATQPKPANGTPHTEASYSPV